MGPAVSTLAVHTTTDATAVKRSRKRSIPSQNYTGNLVAFRQEQPAVRVAAQSEQSLDAPAHTNSPIVTGTPTDQRNSLQASSERAKLATHDGKPATSKDSNKLMLAAIAAISASAVVGSVWAPNIWRDQLPESSAAQQAPTAAQQAPTAAQQSPVAAPLQPIAENLQEPQDALRTGQLPLVSSMDPVFDELAAAQRMADEYVEEIEWLHMQNQSLQEEINVLENETTDLNVELLQLELAMAALELKAQEPVETRIVYNFVDVPLGGNVAVPNEVVDTSGDGADQAVRAYDNDNVAFGDINNLDELTEQEFLDFSEQLLQEEQFIDFSEEFLQQEQLTDQQILSGELGYDPETGFYINAQNNAVPIDSYERGEAIDSDYPIVIE